MSRPVGRGTISRAALAGLAGRVRTWQDRIEKAARNLDLDVVRIGLNQTLTDVALDMFVAERRLRKTYKQGRSLEGSSVKSRWTPISNVRLES